MNRTRAVALVLVAGVGWGCATSSASRPAVPHPPPSAAEQIGSTDAVARFMQGMIGHHAQALDMTRLVRGRSTHPNVQLLAQRIDVSQRDEIALMRGWLQRRGQPVPADDAHRHAAMGHGELMPGMLTSEQLDQLAAASGGAFDRLFLEGMIRHHQGALEMVSQLLNAHRALDAETFRFVSDVDADQRAEIQRMQTLLRSLP